MARVKDDNTRVSVPLTFAAIDPVAERLIESPHERRNGVDGWVTWGENNTYPQYLKGLCKSTPTLRSIILGSIDYVCGDSVTAAHGLPGRADGAFDRKGTTAAELVKETASNIIPLGGLAWKVTLNRDLATVGEIESIPLENLRTDEDCNMFWYSEKWKGYAGTDVKCYPAWTKGTRDPESILYIKLWGDGVYPEPVYAASVKACETERAVDTYHLGNISRGFMGSYIVNFNNGAIPTDQEKKEVERNFTRKFSGAENGGRVMFSWNRNKDAMTTLQKMEVSDYGEKYETLSRHCRQQIFTAFRANPNLFGIPTENNGFNAEEYEQSFKLFNRTMIQPIQRTIRDAFVKVLGEDIITIKPFSLEGYGEDAI